MENNVYDFSLNIDWKFIGALSKLDRFDASWSAIERREGQSLKQLKSIATVRSVGASTRIEGSKMSDEQVNVLLNQLDITTLEDRDAQEVVGYFEALDIIAESFIDVSITENSIKNLHNILMRYSKKDKWHKGNYKQHSNAVEVNYADGTRQIIFKTTEPGYATENAMSNLITWYHSDVMTHPLVKCALFTYEFLSIHPFQDGNGRLSRLISTLLLLKNNYSWIQYVSLEHEIESRKSEYYKVLRSCQALRPTEWTMFFFDALKNIQEQLMTKMEQSSEEMPISVKEKSILIFIGNNPGCKSGEIAKQLDIPSPTIKKILKNLLEKKLVQKNGIGAGTNYASN
jgi:Fic family protein